MTPVGHSLFGASVGVVCMPKLNTTRAKAVFLMGFVLLANIPDLPMSGWGHNEYRVSHSLFVNLGLIAPLAIVFCLWHRAREAIGGTWVILGGAVAWLSHLLLDSFYNHGMGIAIYWPISRARLALPMPWFSTWQSRPPPLNAHTLEVCSIEFLFYSPILLICVCCRRLLRR